jgi:folate-dependent phosphoribosylglycinamide formyltransferase PurN
MTAPLRLAVLLSGSGRTLENLLEWIAAGRLAAEIVVVVTNKPGVRGLAVADRATLPTYIMPRADQPLRAWSAAIFGVCQARRADLVVMAGFLQLVDIPDDFRGRVINIHPALLPAFGGKVDNEYDHGRILLQKAVPVLPDDTAESLAARVFAAECVALPEAITTFGRGLVASARGKDAS